MNRYSASSVTSLRDYESIHRLWIIVCGLIRAAGKACLCRLPLLTIFYLLYCNITPGVFQAVRRFIESWVIFCRNWGGRNTGDGSVCSAVDEAQARWEANYETVKTPEDLATYQKVRKDYFWRQLGALWDKTPLNPKITGRLTKPDYRVEKVVFESLPHFYVTGTVFLPLEEKFAPPYPAVLIVCGHSNEGKAADYYQGIGILAAMNGLASMVMDPIDQGERFQHLGPDGKPFAASVSAHNLVGAGSILLGRNAATFEIWDMQEYWSGLPCPPPRDLPNPRIESICVFYLSCIGRQVLYH